MSDEEFAYTLRYAGEKIPLTLEHAQRVAKAIELASGGDTVLCDINYLIADGRGNEMHRFLIGPGIPALLSGPSFPVPDIVDR
ncbi:hypothetical protein [Mycobacteroides abscessus]|uniref:hypothetical protein n=1 Tax=Mycobacteroides abscessus TaxID=36809 RepID=UPI00067FF2ED|nr:hypothetical protein [Mycobacteroides abscessus]AWG51626.1 hypothetical protein DDT48_21050 [Mycobacteroides abscessus]KNB67057.1 hypothetical protein MAUC95_07690 [Mycobacteroides abscessus]MBN7309661.1 hypothetical protein [Mycobacteroides abscessus subsp. abscessus]MBN7315112.1 hypothetical protein [Mycobacteroides abscessus subsp. abscessus]MBN7372655.1 hypothetical protein [Mycobacteroides abscessus subsp. abscessus]